MNDAGDHNAALSPGQQRELLKRLLRERANAPRQTAASCAQRRLWLVNQLEQPNPSYNVPSYVRLRGALDVQVLERSLGEVARRHDALRTTFHEAEGEPLQVIAPAITVPVTVIDLAHVPGADLPSRLASLIREESEALFDIARGPLIRAKLFRIAPQEHVLVLVMHHIISDGWSVAVIVRELFTIYEAYRAGGESPLAPLPLQYHQHASREARWLEGEEFRRQLAYWNGRLDGLPILELPTDRRRPPVKGFRGATRSFVLDPALSGQLKQLSARTGVTPYMVLSAVFAVLLHRYSRQDDVVFGTPIAARNRAELEGLIGFFANMLVMRVDVSGDPTFSELLSKVAELTLGAYANQDVPFDQLVEKLRPERDPSRNPLFQVAIALHNEAAAPPSVAGLEIGQPVIPSCDAGDFGIEVATTRFDLELHLWEGPEGLRGTWAYDVALFDARTIDRMGRHFTQLLCAIVRDPGQRVSRLDMLTGAERETLRAWGCNPASYPRETTVHALFEQACAASPEAIALMHGDRELRYAELDARANQLARYLERAGLSPGSVVGVCLERGIDLIVTLLAILKSGCAYVPLDTEYPAPRLKFMLEDTGAPVLVTRSGLKPRLPEYGGRIICLDQEWEAVQREDAAVREPVGSADDLAYVMYTSGSTGTPKGVAIPHRGIVRLVRDTDYVQLAPGDRVVQASSVSFDAATFEIWGPLLNGACVVGVERELTLVPADYAAFLRERRISVMFITTALFNQLAREAPDAFSAMRAVLFGGEAVDVDCVRRVLGARGRPKRLLHVYGPTESTTFATWHEVEAVAENDVTVPIGRPIANTELWVLDEKMQPVPAGVHGELYIGGDGLARDYWRRPELTAEKFVPHPHSDDPRARLYRTGDLVRWREPGVIEFAGRIDHQVKLRGFRIELGEIETRLRECDGVRDAVVVLREDTRGGKRLVAYVTAAAGTTLSPAALKSRLQAALPAYMVPAAIVALRELPLNRNGKVDRKALPEPEQERAAPAEPAILQGDLEKEIAGIWKEELGLAQIGAEENFFDLGAHSLMLARVRDKIEKRLHRPVPIVTLFQYPTLRSLSRHLRGADESADQPREDASQATHSAARAYSYATDSIAVVGIAGRFPGARNLEQFWSNLRQGVESVRFFTEEELRAAGVDEAQIRNPRYVRAKGYLEDPELFDASFFGYSPREAAFIDPQQRLFLEVAWEALESAGYDAARCRHAVGVYAGSSENTYWFSLLGHPELRAAGMLENALAAGKDFVATRIAYKMNLRGPAVTLQTACSTSLVAVHHACMSLLNGECGMALAGGVSVSVPTMAGHAYEENSIGSPDGHCRAFDEAGQGTLRGDGAGIVVLKRLADALADGDTIHAVIRGSAINNDGSNKVGYTAPSVEGQAQAISAAIAAAGVDAATISYIEAHGTGTTLGDPIEIAALNQVFGAVAGGNRIGIGSVKTNIGHLDAAAGVAGLIKAILALKHRELPPSLHFTKPNPKLGIEGTPFYVNDRLRPWEAPTGVPRRAGVSSFGIGGTNAHVLLEEAPPQTTDGEAARAHQLLVISARTKAALERTTAALAEALERDPGMELADAAYTLQVGRKRFRHASVVACRGREGALAALRAPAKSGAITTDREPVHQGVAFLFSGQGSQHVDMARGLYEAQPRLLFREVVDECCDKLSASLGLDLRELVYPRAQPEAAAERLTQTRYAQPALFVIEYALARQWMAWGIRPAAMLGHSIGEYVAACLAGVMTLDDALALVAERGRLMYGLPAGSMLSVPLSARDLEPLLGSELSIATLNGPAMSVVSGTHAAIDALQARLNDRGIEAKRLHTSHAFHSPMMQPILDEFTEKVRRIALHPPRIPYVSNLTGDWITAEQATDPGYYARHLRHAVRFSDGLERLYARPDWLLLEAGPGQALTALARRHPRKPVEQAVVASLPRANERKGSEEAYFLQSLGQLWLHGLEPDWVALHAPRRGRRITLPTYPFERQKFWIKPDRSVTTDTAASAKRAELTQWFYAPLWKRRMLATPSPVPPARHWMLFADGNALDDALTQRLRAQGATVVRVVSGERYLRQAPDAYVIDPRSAEDYRRLLTDVAEANATPQRIVHLWGVKPEKVPDDETAFVQRCMDRGCHSVMYLAQAIVDLGIENPVNLLVVTSQVHDVTGGEQICPEKALVLGPCRVMGAEIPSVTARHLDIELPPEADRYPDHLLSALLDEANSDDTEPLIAHRGRYRWVQTVEPLPLASPRDEALPLREGGVYLITGGLGGVGLELAAWLARTVRAKLVLVARSALPPRVEWASYLEKSPVGDGTRAKIERLAAIEALGAEVMAVSADVSDRQQMAAAVAAAKTRFGAIHGVIHAAAVPGGGVLQRQTPQTFAAALAPKVQGTRILDSLLMDGGLDFMALCSSLASLMSLPGRADYVSANAFIDAYAHACVGGSAPRVVAINWDTWVDVGMSVAQLASEGREHVAEDGMRNEEGIEVFRRILAGSSPQVIVSVRAFDPRALQHSWERGSASAGARAASTVESTKAHSSTAPGAEYTVPRRETNPARWTYAPSWRRVPADPASSEGSRAGWLCFVDSSGLGDGLAAELRTSGSRVISVEIGARYAKLADDRYAIDPSAGADYARLLGELKAGGFAPEGVVHLWAVSSETGFEACLDRGFFSLVHLTQALDNHGVTSAEVVLVTTGVHEITGGETITPAKAMAMGPMKAISIEHAGMRVCAVDVTIESADDVLPLARRMAADLRARRREPVIAYRGGYRWVQTFEPMPLPAPSGVPAKLRSGGIYLVTGGFGNVGFAIAEYLARAVKAKLAFVSRIPLPPREQWTSRLERSDDLDNATRKIRQMLTLEALGAEVLVCQADVTDEAQMRGVLETVERHFGALHGVVHAACAEKQLVPVRMLEKAACFEQFRPQVDGLQVLERVLRDRPIDFCLVNSSLVTILGAFGAAAYAASNQFMDAFVQRRNRRSKSPWIVVNWDNWSVKHQDAGAVRDTHLEFYINTDEGGDILGRVLGHDVSQVAVSTGDLQARIEQWQKREESEGRKQATPDKAVSVERHARPALSSDYLAPRDDVERTLAAIWEELLGIAGIGVHDNFFELGGDSVIGIQFTARAKQKGIRLTPKQIFEHETIAELAAVCGSLKTSASAENESASGSVPLTPIQRWFFEQRMPGHDLNMAVILETSTTLRESALQDAVQALVVHHEALRLRVSEPCPQTAEMTILSGDRVPVQRVDLSGLDPQAQAQRIEAMAEEAQRGMDIARGPIVRVVHFDLGRRPGRLLIVIHHLAVDAVAWRILLEDLQTACSQLAAGNPVVLPAKTTSLRRWSERLNEYAQTDAAEAELGYWRALGETTVAPLPVDLSDGDNTIANTSNVSRELDENETGALLKEIPQAYKTQINDALLTALAQAFAGWTGQRQLYLHLEGHGRDAFADDLDVSRTVGWFTTVYPVRLELPAGGESSDALIAVKEQLRAIPHHGMNFGVLRYLSRKHAVREVMRAVPDPELVFLYLGRFDQGVTGTDGLFAPASESTGFERSPQSRRAYLLEITALVTGDRLRVNWRYSTTAHRQATIEKIADAFMASLRELIAHCSAAQTPRFTASDFPAARLDQSMLDQLAASLNISEQESTTTSR